MFTFQAARELLPERLARAIAGESRVARLPGIRQRGHDPGRWRWLLPYMPRYFEHLDLSDYEVVISSSHACAVGVRPPANALHLCYCYTPMRYVWMPDAERGRASGVKGIALTTLRGRLRAWDHRAAQRPDVYLAISSAVAERIQRFYGREAQVVPRPWPSATSPGPRARPAPPSVGPSARALQATARGGRGVPRAARPAPDDGRRGAAGGRAARRPAAKRGAAGMAFARAAGGAYAGASGFIHVGEEDFGITMVEAMAAGHARGRGRPRRRARHRAPRPRRGARFGSGARLPRSPPACVSCPPPIGTQTSSGAVLSVSRRRASANGLEPSSGLTVPASGRAPTCRPARGPLPEARR